MDNNQIDILESSPIETLDIQSHAQKILEEILSSFRNPKIGLKKTAQKMGVHERTLDRLKKSENKPNYQTLLRLYKLYYNIQNEEKLLEQLPKNVSNYLKKFTVQSNNIQMPIESIDIVDRKLQENPVIAEIYVIAGTGPFHRDLIEKRFGQYGITLLEELVSESILGKTKEDFYFLGTKQATFNIPTILKTGLVMTRNHFNQQNAYELDKNHIAFLAEGLTVEEYHSWLSIDQEAYLKKAEILKNKSTHGTIRAFTFMVTDHIQPEDFQ